MSLEQGSVRQVVAFRHPLPLAQGCGLVVPHWPALQIGKERVPFEQFAWQALPQEPQLALSVWRFVQAPKQLVCPGCWQ